MTAGEAGRGYGLMGGVFFDNIRGRREHPTAPGMVLP